MYRRTRSIALDLTVRTTKMQDPPSCLVCLCVFCCCRAVSFLLAALCTTTLLYVQWLEVVFACTGCMGTRTGSHARDTCMRWMHGIACTGYVHAMDARDRMHGMHEVSPGQSPTHARPHRTSHLQLCPSVETVPWPQHFPLLQHYHRTCARVRMHSHQRVVRPGASTRLQRAADNHKRITRTRQLQGNCIGHAQRTTQ